MKLPATFERLRHARATSSGTTGVYRVREPRWLGNSAAAEAEKWDLLVELLARYPRCYIWIDVWNEHIADELQAVGGSKRSGHAGWFHVSEKSMAFLRDQLHHGAWGLFFFHLERNSDPAPLEGLPDEPETLATIIGELGASVAIISWYDDVEWLVAFADTAD